jgi:glycine dehydrogenase subunit 1
MSIWKRTLRFLVRAATTTTFPAVVPAITSRGEFATAYTPYQAETSQGTLQVIYEFQTLLCQLTQMEMANASLYDGATALAEALIMAMASNQATQVLVAANSVALLSTCCAHLFARFAGGD